MARAELRSRSAGQRGAASDRCVMPTFDQVLFASRPRRSGPAAGRSWAGQTRDHPLATGGARLPPKPPARHVQACFHRRDPGGLLFRLRVHDARQRSHTGRGGEAARAGRSRPDHDRLHRRHLGCMPRRSGKKGRPSGLDKFPLLRDARGPGPVRATGTIEGRCPCPSCRATRALLPGDRDPADCPRLIAPEILMAGWLCLVRL